MLRCLRPPALRDLPSYSPKSEGVHCASARLARGGLRWSDRMRTSAHGVFSAWSMRRL
ncbi:NAD-glutamate dehydrogenase domain-containing protein [Nonomuraea dietziae]|uniref:NAD-glutamate dehydrogenase domain-containing protein n=1 Tax=Nonomuraea dietziae TaxID=65515 RepID=UPI003CD08E76